ncbi:hypothetical protein MYFR107205_29425 [Mycolicibacterium frederiksbergense]
MPAYPAPPPPPQPWGGPPPHSAYPAQGAAPLSGDFIAKVRSNKLLLHAAAGTVGGAVGALLAEVAANIYDASTFMSVVTTGLWSCIFASVIAVALFLSDAWHQRRVIQPGRALVVWILGAVAGFIAGAVAQSIFLIDFGSIEFKNYVLRSFCWGIAGVLIGGMLSRTVPNLGLARGAAAGFVGGCAGGICFVLVSNYLPEMLGRIIGIAAIGLALGVAMYVVESMFREASLQVIWGPHDTAHVGLGAQPVTIGGGIEDDVVVAGLPSHAASVVLANGHIEYVDNSTGQRTPLTNGSQFQVGSVGLVVHAGQ